MTPVTATRPTPQAEPPQAASRHTGLGERFTPRWVTLSVRNKLLAMALLPLLVVLPLLMVALLIWSNITYDRLLVTKVRSDLAVARGYFNQVLGEVGAGAAGLAGSHRLRLALAQAAQGQHEPLQRLLDEADTQLVLDFVAVYSPDGRLLARNRNAGPSPEPTGTANTASVDTQRRLPRSVWQEPPSSSRPLAPAGQTPVSPSPAKLVRLPAQALEQLAPSLLPRTRIPVLPTEGARPDGRTWEDRALVMLASLPVVDETGKPLALVRAGLLLNQNLPLVDHINRIVYPEGALPFGSVGTTTLFMDDVRITTNVRLFQNERAIGTRVSAAVHDTVLGAGQTWLDRAFVVNDWYTSAYEPLLDTQGERVGMLYVGFLERPFRWVKYGLLAIILALFLGVMALAALVSVRWARSIFAPVERMNDTMLRVQHGEASARVGATAAADEIGLLARHLDELLDAIDQKTLALEDWGHSLDRKVADRTHELAQANASLRRAHEQLTRSEKLAAVGQLTASIAHEINNPIAVIQGNLDLLRDTLGPAALPCIEEFRLLDAQVERMRLIVTQLLQYARPTEFAGYVETLDANQVVRDSLVLVSHLLGSQRVVVEHHLCARQRIGINRQELQQVLINLLINAIAAMPGGGRLVLSSADGLLPAPGSPGWVQLTVQDTGTGFAPLMRERLFQPFQTTKSDGNGLGLWISQSLLERYGARITAANVEDTEPGQPGARIVLHLWCEPQIPDESSASTNNGRLDTKKL